jgi:hypothetical protein
LFSLLISIYKIRYFETETYISLKKKDFLVADKNNTLSRLNKEKEYEDSLSERLTSYFITSVDGIQELSDKEKAKIKDSLLIILDETKRHSYLFNQLVQMVTEDGENQY